MPERSWSVVSKQVPMIQRSPLPPQFWTLLLACACVWACALPSPQSPSPREFGPETAAASLTHPSPVDPIRLISRLKSNPSAGHGHRDGTPADTPEGFLEDLFTDAQALRAERHKQVVELVAIYVA